MGECRHGTSQKQQRAPLQNEGREGGKEGRREGRRVSIDLDVALLGVEHQSLQLPTLLRLLLLLLFSRFPIPRPLPGGGGEEGGEEAGSGKGGRRRAYGLTERRNEVSMWARYPSLPPSFPPSFPPCAPASETRGSASGSRGKIKRS